ncbi:MAG: hypothetical protein VW397_07850 [Candidatus Margulisiibacteriota bacterium]
MKQLRYLIFICITMGFLWLVVNAIQHIQAEVHHRNGYIQIERGYPKLSNISFKRAVDLMPWETHYRLQLAKSYEKTAQTFPNEFKAYTNLAIKEYQRLIEQDELNPWFKARLGLIYHDLYKKYPKSEIYKKLAHDFSLAATINDPKNPLFTLHYAHLLYTYGELDLAKEYYLKTIEYDNDLLEAHYNIAAIYEDENQKDKTKPHYERIIEYLKVNESKPTSAINDALKKNLQRFQNARIKLAKYYLEKNDMNAAFQLINDVPISVEKYELLGAYYTKINRIDEAISVYKQLNLRLNTNEYDSIIKQLQSQ